MDMESITGLIDEYMHKIRKCMKLNMTEKECAIELLNDEHFTLTLSAITNNDDFDNEEDDNEIFS